MRKILALIIILISLFLIARGWWSNQLAPVSESKEYKIVLIEKGKSPSEIANQLKKEGLIKSPLLFNLYVRQTGASTKLQTGRYKLSPSMSVGEIIKTLQGSPAEKWITFLEGWRVEEMAQKLKQEFDIEEQEFLRFAKEGYMFPDTYLFPPDTTAKQVADRLIATFDLKFSDDLKSKIKSQGLTEKEGIILASIVEREARSEKVRTEIAGILLKRYKIVMALNADATIQYALGYQMKEKSWWKRHLSKEDLKVDSPFNTYLYAGLPPSPIANPSLSSLKAVASADSSTPYLYYYHDSKGNSYYAKTLEEHNANVANHP